MQRDEEYAMLAALLHHGSNVPASALQMAHARLHELEDLMRINAPEEGPTGGFWTVRMEIDGIKASIVRLIEANSHVEVLATAVNKAVEAFDFKRTVDQEVNAALSRQLSVEIERAIRGALSDDRVMRKIREGVVRVLATALTKDP